jgi:hypothetical protein
MHATPDNGAIATVAIDLAKDVFELAFVDADARIVERRRLNRTEFARVLDNRPPLRVVMEACGSAHYWARRFARQQRPSAASRSRVDSRIRCSDPVNPGIVSISGCLEVSSV